MRCLIWGVGCGFAIVGGGTGGVGGLRGGITLMAKTKSKVKETVTVACTGRNTTMVMSSVDRGNNGRAIRVVAGDNNGTAFFGTSASDTTSGRTLMGMAMGRFKGLSVTYGGTNVNNRTGLANSCRLSD